MKFGIFYELQLPRPWQAGDELRLYQNALTQVELADRLGYDYAWEVEHHFLEEYSHSPSPELFLAAASQRTKNIRLGHGILQLTTNHPARVAERIAALDLVSNGRVEFGMGESASITELEPFGRDMETKREVFEEAVRAIIPMFKDGGSEHHGKYFNMPLRNVLPKPVQKPHPPLWVACSQLDHRMAGRAALARSASSSSPPTPRMPGCTPTTTPSPSGRTSSPTTRPTRTSRWSRSSCAPRPTRRRARAPTAPPSSSSRCASTAQSQTAQRPAPGTVNMWDEYNKWKRDNPEAPEAALRGGLIGSPETIRRKLRRFQTSHIDQVILLNQAGKNTPRAYLRVLELFAAR